MFGIKTFIYSHVWNSVFKRTSKWPSKEQPIFMRWIKTLLITKKGYTHYLPYQFGHLLAPPNQTVAKIFSTISLTNPNALGQWATNKIDQNPIHTFEHESIRAMISLYHAHTQSIEGYVTSGGTEGNIFSAWLGVSSISANIDRSHVCLLRTDLSHYSISKASRLIGIQEHIIPLDPIHFNMHVFALKDTIAKLHKRGMRGFLIPLTVGYTATGTSDDIKQITQQIEEIKKIYTDATFYIWIDAALNGLTTPFVVNNFSPFRFPLISAFVVDFHKFGGSPYGSGMILHRAHLKRYIERSVNYFPEKDATLLGSRNGASPVAIWSAIQLLGVSYFKKNVKRQLRHKELFISSLKRISSNIDVCTSDDSVTCGIIFKDLPNQKLPSSIENSYGLYAKTSTYMFVTGKKRLKIYPIYFLQHCCIGDVQNIIQDIKQYYEHR